MLQLLIVPHGVNQNRKPKPSKTNNHNGQWISIFQKVTKNLHNATF
jgi:hypothetical protein